MSSKSKRLGKKISLPQVPREIAVINEDYGRMVSQAGQAQYQIDVMIEDLKNLNKQMRNLNYEAAARNKLDKAKQGEAAIQALETPKEAQ